jgi:hypothetical protein
MKIVLLIDHKTTVEVVKTSNSFAVLSHHAKTIFENQEPQCTIHATEEASHGMIFSPKNDGKLSVLVMPSEASRSPIAENPAQPSVQQAGKKI